MTNEIGNGRERYLTKRYLHTPRWTTYAELIKCVLELNPSKILEIGIGNRLVADILKKMGFNIKTMDIDKSLNPDYVLDVRKNNILKFKNQFNLIIASQTLEHIKYTDYLKVMNNLSLITKNLIITLPYCDKNDYFFAFSIHFPFFKKSNINIKFGFKLYSKKLPQFYNKDHHWEIGTKGLPLRIIKKDIKKSGWIIMKNFFNHNHPYHYFFLLFSRNFAKKNL